ncbi:MAG: hypothetical protein KC910_20605, partial [Candidatus Eremiobacteraeota bacterium]|nr:hypothetical protein [Candidatus Eremiobacteraeota bacterium]
MRIAGARPVKDWTLLCYNAGQADAGKMGTSALLDLERTGSDEHTHVVALNHRSGWWPEQMLEKVGLFRGAQGTAVYEVGPKSERREPWLVRAHRPFPKEFHRFAQFVYSSPSQLQSRVVERLPDETNVGQAETLKQFLIKNMERYPARRYGLVMTGHGAAFAGQMIVHGPEGRMQGEEIAQVLREVEQETGKKLDLLNLNTCYGANLETLYPLRGVVDTVVASEGVVFAATQPLGAQLANLQQKLHSGQEVDGPGLARLMVEESRRQPLANSYTRTLSALDTRGFDQLAEAVAGLQEQLKTLPGDEVAGKLEECRRFLFNSRHRPVHL